MKLPRRLLVLAIALVLASLAGRAAEAAGGRVALVIGNSVYKNVPVLPNPANDAGDIAAALKRLGFAVTLLANAGFDDMRRGLVSFGHDAAGADIAAIFFAGHGLEIGGENWLVPIDADLKRDADVESEAVSLRSLILQVSNTASLGLVILDACRNDPFATKIQRAIPTRAVIRGLSRVEPSGNVLVAYAARDGTTALDGDGRNSPFSAALLRNIETPGLEITFMFRNVRDDVMEATRNEQQPFVYGSLSRKAIYLAGQSTSADQAQTDEAGRVWLTIRDSTSPAVLDDFVKRYASTPYGGIARARLDELRQKQANAAPNSPPAIDPGLIGTWEIMVPSDRGPARWIWRVLPDGTYKFHSEGGRPAPTHEGTMSAMNGRWSLRALKGLLNYDDGGSYELRDDTAVIAGKLGTGYWKRNPRP